MNILTTPKKDLTLKFVRSLDRVCVRDDSGQECHLSVEESENLIRKVFNFRLNVVELSPRSYKQFS